MFLLPPYFDHDPFMHHPIHVLDAPVCMRISRVPGSGHGGVVRDDDHADNDDDDNDDDDEVYDDNANNEYYDNVSCDYRIARNSRWPR